METGLNTIQETGLMTPRATGANRVDDLYSPEYFGGLSQLSAAAAASRLFGEATKEQLFMILMTGREMGISPTVALRSVGVFKGKTVISSQLQLAKVKEAGYRVEILENTDTTATVSVQKPGQSAYTKTFTMDDAKKAGLLERNALYRTSPATMLLNRAIGLACRYGAPEVLNGLHNADELAEMDEPGSPQPPRTVLGSASSPMAEREGRGWDIEAQEAYVDLDGRLYSALKSAGQANEHPKHSNKWKDRQAKDAPDVVLPEFQAFVAKLEKAVEAKAQAAAETKKPDLTPLLDEYEAVVLEGTGGDEDLAKQARAKMAAKAQAQADPVAYLAGVVEAGKAKLAPKAVPEPEGPIMEGEIVEPDPMAESLADTIPVEELQAVVVQNWKRIEEVLQAKGTRPQTISATKAKLLNQFTASVNPSESEAFERAIVRGQLSWLEVQ